MCFSYGVMLWEMLTREIPNEGLQVVPLVKKATSGKLALDMRESIPEAYKKLLLGKSTLSLGID